MRHNMRAQQGLIATQDECDAVMACVAAPEATGVRDFRLVHNGRQCVMMLVCAPVAVFEELCSTLPEDAPLVLYADGKWKFSRLSRDVQVVLVSTRLRNNTLVLA